MVKGLFAATFVSGALAAGKLAVTWEDCGDASTHGHVTDVQPTEITIGGDGTLTATGTIDETVTDGSFTIQLAADLGIKETYTGKACEAKTFKLPLGIGSVSWGGLSCPVAAGTITTPVAFTTSSIIPAALAKADVSASAVDQNGEKAICVTAHLQKETTDDQVVGSDDEQWEAYKQEFKKVYHDDADEAARKQLFLKSLERIDSLNKLNGAKAFGLTRESDRYENEKHAKGAVRPKNHKTAPLKSAKNSVAPAAVDWRKTIAVTPVKNQGQCGSCWAFSATEGIESQYVLDASPEYAIEMSPQQITSCTTSCDGCQGGWPYAGYEYVKSVAGLSNEWYWPYTQSMIASSSTATCATNVTIFNGPDASLAGGHATVTGYNYVIPECASGACANQDMQGLAAAVAEGPVSICVNAGAWNDYTGGVLSSAACGGYAADDLDHCVQLVGYNTTASSPYWIVKNSWSTTWGEDGYVFLEYPANTCGLGNEATRPVIGNAAGDAAARQRLVDLAISPATATMV